MQYELLADTLVERYNAEEGIIVTEGLFWPAAILAGAAASWSYNWYIDTFHNGELPAMLTEHDDEWWWVAGSLFDFTGAMSQPYFQEAKKELAANPDDQWLNIKYWLTFMATIPFTAFNPFAISWKVIKLVSFITGITWITKAISRLFTHMGTMLKGAGAIDRGIPLILAQMSSKGQDAVKMRNVIEKAFNVKIADADILKAAKAKNVKLQPGLVKGVGETGGLFKGAVKLGAGAAKLGGKAGKLVGAGSAMAKWFHNKPGGSGTNQKPIVQGGPPVLYGWEGGRIGP